MNRQPAVMIRLFIDFYIVSSKAPCPKFASIKQLAPLLTGSGSDAELTYGLRSH